MTFEAVLGINKHFALKMLPKATMIDVGGGKGGLFADRRPYGVSANVITNTNSNKTVAIFTVNKYEWSCEMEMRSRSLVILRHAHV